MSQERFVWLAKFINDQKPDCVVDSGDFDEFGSLSSHERDDTYKGRLKPLLAADLEASAQARMIIKKNLTHQCRKIVTLGNHEHRIWTYENNNPAISGIASAMYNDILTATGWESYQYGAYVNIAGMNFTHVPFDQNGKPVAGEGAAKKVAEKSQVDCAFGHIHSETIIRAHKFDTNNSVTVLCASCFMPEGYRPDYVKNTRKEYSHGAYVLMIKDGRIKSIKSYCMDELEALYGRN